MSRMGVFISGGVDSLNAHMIKAKLGQKENSFLLVY